MKALLLAMALGLAATPAKAQFAGLYDAQATQLLLDLARGHYPRSIRRDALFWLAQSDDEQALEALTQLLSR